MTSLRAFVCNDMFKFNGVNLDALTETYGLSFYMQYLAHWPEYFQGMNYNLYSLISLTKSWFIDVLVALSPSGEIMGYSK